MGFFSKCICCPCLSQEKSVKVCTWLYIIFNILTTLACLKNGGGQLLVALITAVITVSLILLLVGIKNGNPTYLKEYNTIFGIAVSLKVIGLLIIVGLGITTIAELSYVVNNDNALFINEDREYYKKLRIVAVLEMIFSAISVFIDIDYYFSTRYYIDGLLKDIDAAENAKNLENAN